MTRYSLAVEGVNNCSKHFANFQVGVVKGERIREKGGSLLRISLSKLLKKGYESHQNHFTFIKHLLNKSKKT